MAQSHTGDTAIIRQHFLDHPDEEFKTRQLVTEFGLERWQVSNAIQHLIRRNIVVRGHARGYFRLRKDAEKREEFKVAKVAKPVVQKVEPMVYPTFSGKVHPELWAIIRGPIKDQRVTVISGTSAIIWNSEVQRSHMVRRSIGHYAH